MMGRAAELVEYRPHILIILDDKGKMAEISRKLQRADCQVAAVRGAKTVLQVLELIRFDVLLVDWFLPEMCADELIAAVKAQHPDMQIIFTGVPAILGEMVCECGADAWTQDAGKPGVFPALLAASMQSVLSNAQAASFPDDCWEPLPTCDTLIREYEIIKPAAFIG